MAFKIKETILGISIAIVFVLFIGFGIEAFYPAPKYEQFCNSTAYFEKPYPLREPYKEYNVSVCNKIDVENFALEQECAGSKGFVMYEPDENGCRVAKGCNLCQKHFDDARNIYNRNVFIISGGIGIMVIIIGAVLNLVSVSAGLFGGGVLTILYGIVRYWSELAQWARFIIFGITLFVLIWIGYNKLNKK